MSYNKYNNIRRLQISDQNFTFQSKSNFDDAFITKFLDTYKRYLQLLSPNFFTSTATIEIQNNIIRNNFGEDIDINSFRETAFQQQVTAQIYAFFIHIAAHSALEALDPLVPSILAQGAEDYVELQEAKSKSKKKKKNKKEKSKSEKEIIDSDDAPEGPIRNSLDDAIFEDDHEIGTNTNHAEQSGTKSSNDQQPMEIVNDIPEVQDNQLQDDQQPVNNNSNKTKSSNKKNKSKKNEVLKVLTGYTPTDTSQVRDILVYDIPVSWTAEKILQDLTLWGKTISINSKRQKKYQTVRIKIDLSSFRFAQFEANQNPAWTTDLGGIPVRWFPARWNLKERKQREKFQATLHKIPDSMTMATLWKESRPHSTLSGVKGLKSFKIIQTARGDRKLIGYFEKWEDMRYALDNQFVWESQKLTWKRHDPPKQRWKSLQKTERISRNQQQNQQNSKNSKKKPQETKSQKSKKTDKKKDKSRKASRSKILAEILDTLRKLV